MEERDLGEGMQYRVEEVVGREGEVEGDRGSSSEQMVVP